MLVVKGLVVEGEVLGLERVSTFWGLWIEVGGRWRWCLMICVAGKGGR